MAFDIDVRLARPWLVDRYRRYLPVTDAMLALAEKQSFHGVRFDGITYDCGSSLGFLTANAAFALARDDLAPASTS